MAKARGSVKSDMSAHAQLLRSPTPESLPAAAVTHIRHLCFNLTSVGNMLDRNVTSSCSPFIDGPDPRLRRRWTPHEHHARIAGPVPFTIRRQQADQRVGRATRCEAARARLSVHHF